LNSKKVRQAVLDEYKKNYDNYRETTSKNYAATVMSPLQVIATVTKQMQDNAKQEQKIIESTTGVLNTKIRGVD
jgi:hypothetical protein